MACKNERWELIRIPACKLNLNSVNIKSKKVEVL